MSYIRREIRKKLDEYSNVHACTGGRRRAPLLFTSPAGLSSLDHKNGGGSVSVRIGVAAVVVGRSVPPSTF
jgi:hypothetical protein